MKSLTQIAIWGALLFFAITPTIQAQLLGWNEVTALEITDNRGVGGTDYAFPLFINTADLITNNQLQPGGEDLRFATSCAGDTVIPHFIDAGLNTDSTLVWVLLPELPTNGSITIYMLTDNDTASSTSDQTTVFPNMLVFSADDTIGSGPYNVDWFEIESGVTVSAYDTLTNTVINAKRVLIDGVLDLSAAGYGGYKGDTAGSGPGGGGISTGAGSGGGAYGGDGGIGGYDPTDDPPLGGNAYGTPDGFDIDMGSAGAGSRDGGVTAETKGGNGGGALSINSLVTTITGTISVNGENGEDNTVARLPGGGAGGGVLLMSDVILQTGTITAVGGDAGMTTNTSTFTDGGGGGGGGRIKKFYYGHLANSGTDIVAGGALAPNGSATPNLPEDGDPGTVFDSLIAGGFDVTVVNLGATQGPMITGQDTVCVGAEGDYEITTNVPVSYNWTATGGTIVSGQGTDNVTVEWNGAGDNTLTSATTSLSNGCTAISSFTVFGSTATPTADFSYSGGECANTPVNFTNESTIPTGTITDIAWDFGDGNTSLMSDPTNTYVQSGTYTAQLIVTSDIGCSDTTSQAIPVADRLEAQVTIATTTNDDSLCADEGYNLRATGINGGVGISYQWYQNGQPVGINSNAFGAYNLTEGDEFYVEMTSSLGCIATATVSSNVLVAIECPEDVSGLTHKDRELMNVSVMPNPSSGMFTVQLQNVTAATTLEVFSLQGQLVLTQSIEEQGLASVKVDLSEFSQGVYLLQVRNEQGIGMSKLVKE